MRYPARIHLRPEGGYVICFRDFPEVSAEGDDLPEAIEGAERALEEGIDAITKDGCLAPKPSVRRTDEMIISMRLRRLCLPTCRGLCGYSLEEINSADEDNAKLFINGEIRPARRTDRTE